MEDLLHIVTNWGPAGVLAAAAIYLYREERKERMAAQQALQDIGKRSIEADFTTAKSLDTLSGALNNL
ncbi:MAG TPA: hypothetical protein VIV09_01960, partial [Pseudolabrys sp.]